MKHAHFECVGGASGDMILGAMVELGIPPDNLKSALKGLNAGSFDITAETATSKHIKGLRLKIVIDGQPHASEPAQTHDHHHEHEHRSLSDIKKMIRHAKLDDSVKESATRIFEALGRAEAKIHGVPVEHIHFHEVGALDSILDIVGNAWALHQLGITSVSVGAIPCGHGVIRCAHGVFPNPAPATLELIAGMPVVQTDEPFELVTPTGAALLSQWKNTESIPHGARLLKTVYSLGQRELNNRPNVLRVSLYESVDANECHDSCLMLECNLDDTTPELIGVLLEDVLAAGALDATCTPVTMKKQRPGILFSVLCEPDMRDKMIDVIFRGSTTFGIREYTVRRTKLERRFEKVSTPYGEVSVKVGSRRGEVITRSPEISDCIRVAREKNVSVREVYGSATRNANKSH